MRSPAQGDAGRGHFFRALCLLHESDLHVRRRTVDQEITLGRDHHRDQRRRAIHCAVQAGTAARRRIGHALRALPGVGICRARPV